MKKLALIRGAEEAPTSWTLGMESGSGVVSTRTCWLNLAGNGYWMFLLRVGTIRNIPGLSGGHFDCAMGEYLPRSSAWSCMRFTMLDSTEASLGAEVIATGDADWFNAPSSGAFLATLDLVDFALPNTATIPTTIDI